MYLTYNFWKYTAIINSFSLEVVYCSNNYVGLNDILSIDKCLVLRSISLPLLSIILKLSLKAEIVVRSVSVGILCPEC